MWEEMVLSDEDGAWLAAHPGELERFRGEWVVVYKKQVVAHSPDGRVIAREAPAKDYPDSTMFYVPTLEEAAGVRIL